MNNPEQRVIDDIDKLVDETMAAALIKTPNGDLVPRDDYSKNYYAKCELCDEDWHGLPRVENDCPGAYAPEDVKRAWRGEDYEDQIVFDEPLVATTGVLPEPGVTIVGFGVGRDGGMWIHATLHMWEPEVGFIPVVTDGQAETINVDELSHGVALPNSDGVMICPGGAGCPHMQCETPSVAPDSGCV